MVCASAPEIDVVLVDQFNWLDVGVAIFYLGDLLSQFVVTLECAVSRKDVANHNPSVQVLSYQAFYDAVGDAGAGPDYKQTHWDI